MLRPVLEEDYRSGGLVTVDFLDWRHSAADMKDGRLYVGMARAQRQSALCVVEAQSRIIGMIRLTTRVAEEPHEYKRGSDEIERV